MLPNAPNAGTPIIVAACRNQAYVAGARRRSPPSVATAPAARRCRA